MIFIRKINHQEINTDESVIISSEEKKERYYRNASLLN